MQTRVKDEVRNYIVEKLLSGDGRDFDDNTDLQQTAILDSFATLELVQFLESEFGIELEANQINAASFQSVTSIAAMLESTISSSSG